MSDGLKRNLAIGAVVVLFGIAGYRLWSGFAGETAPDHYRVLMDAETGQIVQVPHSTKAGEYPHVNSKTGRRTLYPTEVCLWNQCGQKEGGTRVILNHWLNKPEPTVCPVCGREVKRRNPVPHGKESAELAESTSGSENR